MKNPFQSTSAGFASSSARVVETVNAGDRCELVKTFTRSQCQAAMQITYLQASVYQAIQRRLRELERARLAARQGAA